MTADTAGWYRRFAGAARHCPPYRDLALAIADAPDLLRWIDELPPPRRQPNLLLACLRVLTGAVPTEPSLRATLDARPDDLRALMMRRSTQTNEPGRCAALLPFLTRLPQPLALIEVGASAGLCLYPDRYGYDYGETVLPAPGGGPVLPCRIGPGLAVPRARPRIVWRAGLDLNPLDPADADDMAWLAALVWPGQDDRLTRLRAAARVAAAARADDVAGNGHGPGVVRGDLTGDDLDRLAADAPPGATLVIFHTAVLTYVRDIAARRDFARRAQALAGCWLANEDPGVLPWIADADPPADLPPASFRITVNGAIAGWADPHGAWVRGA